MTDQIQELITLDPQWHSYKDAEGNIYTSVSKVLRSFVKPFRTQMIAEKVAAKSKRTIEEVLAEWQEKQQSASAHGERIHEAIERFQQTGVILDTDTDLEGLLGNLALEYQGYHEIRSEVILYDDEFKVAGTADRLLYHTRSPKSVIDIDDYKTNLRRGIEYFNTRRDYMLPPLNHLQYCNYNVYSLQLSAYAYFLEKTFGRKIGRLSIIQIKGTPIEGQDRFIYGFQRVPVPYMKETVSKVFEYYRHDPGNWLESHPDDEVWI